jgi:hypothetical protein
MLPSGFIISENVCIFELTQITYLSRSKTSERQDRTTDSRLETANETMNGELKGGVHIVYYTNLSSNMESCYYVLSNLFVIVVIAHQKICYAKVMSIVQPNLSKMYSQAK